MLKHTHHVRNYFMVPPLVDDRIKFEVFVLDVHRCCTELLMIRVEGSFASLTQLWNSGITKWFE